MRIHRPDKLDSLGRQEDQLKEYTPRTRKQEDVRNIVNVKTMSGTLRDVGHSKIREIVEHVETIIHNTGFENKRYQTIDISFDWSEILTCNCYDPLGFNDTAIDVPYYKTTFRTISVFPPHQDVTLASLRQHLLSSLLELNLIYSGYSFTANQTIR